MNTVSASNITQTPSGEHAPVEERTIAHSLLAQVPYHAAVEFIAVPCGIDAKGRLEVAMACVNDHRAVQQLQMHTGRLIKPVPAEKETVMQLIARNYGRQIERKKDARAPSARRLLEINSNGSTITIVNDIIHEAIRLTIVMVEPYYC